VTQVVACHAAAHWVWRTSARHVSVPEAEHCAQLVSWQWTAHPVLALHPRPTKGARQRKMPRPWSNGARNGVRHAWHALAVAWTKAKKATQAAESGPAAHAALALAIRLAAQTC